MIGGLSALMIMVIESNLVRDKVVELLEKQVQETRSQQDNGIMYLLLL